MNLQLFFTNLVIFGCVFMFSSLLEASKPHTDYFPQWYYVLLGSWMIGTILSCVGTVLLLIWGFV